MKRKFSCERTYIVIIRYNDFDNGGVDAIKEAAYYMEYNRMESGESEKGLSKEDRFWFNVEEQKMKVF